MLILIAQTQTALSVTQRNKGEAMNDRFLNNLEHAYLAYRCSASWCIEASRSKLPFDLFGLKITKSTQFDSILIELGWAFTPRFYAILESFHIAIGYDKFEPFKKEYLIKKFTPEDVIGFEVLTKLRNIIMHGDGDEQAVRPTNRLNLPKDNEPHLLPKAMEQFYDLLKRLFSSADLVNKEPTGDA